MSQDNPIYQRPPAYVDGEPFKNDLFERKLLAERITKYIDQLNNGCVIAVDAPWGEGKSYFGRNWAAQLSTQGYQTIFLDAFEQDYADDPFLLISAEILSPIKGAEGDESWTSLRDACIRTGTVLLPAAAKMAVNAAGKMFFGIGDLAEIKDKLGDELEGKLGETVEKFIQKRLDDYEQEKQTACHFREKLAEFAAKQEKPVVFFIDELDRCKPSFAVKVIERIKHFFDTSNLVFVLLLNRPQLEEAIKGVYGANIDANAYLGKFIQLFLALPKHTSLTVGSRCYNHTYCLELLKRYKFEGTRSGQVFSQVLSIMATIHDLSLRDLERAFIYFALAHPLNDLAGLGAYIISLKIANPELYRQIVLNDKEAHIQAIDLIESLLPKTDNFWLLTLVRTLHRGIAYGVEELTEAEKADFIGGARSIGIRPEKIFRHLGSKIDTVVFY